MAVYHQIQSQQAGYKRSSENRIYESLGNVSSNEFLPEPDCERERDFAQNKSILNTSPDLEFLSSTRAGSNSTFSTVTLKNASPVVDSTASSTDRDLQSSNIEAASAGLIFMFLLVVRSYDLNRAIEIVHQESWPLPEVISEGIAKYVRARDLNGDWPMLPVIPPASGDDR